MKTSTRRRAGALTLTAGLLAGSVLGAGPAQAFPAGSWWYGQLGVPAAQQISTGRGVVVAVVDTGVAQNLGDLRGQVLPGKSFVGGSANADVAGTKDRYSGHGTAMASYIAGTGKGAGMVGIAPGAKILPVRDGNNDDGVTPDAAAQGIVWAAQHGAKVINVSSGGQSSCPANMQQAVDYAVRHDAIVVAATGNDPGISIGFPANCIGAIAVGGRAYSTAFKPWSGGTTGPQLDFVAPAEHMQELLLDNTLSNPDSSGTSNATALVSGEFALLRSHFPHDSARQIVTRALWNVHNGLGGKIFAKRVDNSLGYGEILANYALKDAPPKNAANPIYDEIDKHLKGSSSAPASSSAGSSAAGDGSSPAAPSTVATSNSDSGGPSPAVIVLVVVVVVLVVGGIGAVIARSRRRPRY